MPDRLRLAAQRPEDLLALEFEFINLRSVAGGALERIASGEPALIVVRFPSQHIAEKVFSKLNAGTQELIPAAMAGASRLVFRLPDDLNQLPLTLESLLNWEKWELAVASGPPGELETAIEFPWRLILSPDGTARWSNPIEPVTIDGNTQLWQTDLVHNTPLVPGGNVRAFSSVPGDPSFTPPLVSRVRQDLVALTSPLETRPITAESLSLSILGASARLHGEWPKIPGSTSTIGLTKYEHVATQGRDQQVITTSTGFLCGTGHRASIVKTIERSPADIAGGALFGTAAFLCERHDVIIEQPCIDYRPMAGAYSFKGREMPLESICLVTRSAQVQESAYSVPTWLMTPEGQPLLFKAVASDKTGNQISFQLHLMFVPFEKVGEIQTIGNIYIENPFGRDKARNIDLHGQIVAMADPGKKRLGSTEVKAETIELGLAAVGGTGLGFDADLDATELPPSYVPRFLPFVVSAKASLPALEELLGGTGAHEIEYDKTYLDNGFDAQAMIEGKLVALNPGQTFIGLKAALPIEFPSQRGGGLVRPNTAVKALSRTLGAVSAPVALQEGKVDLSAFKNARFLGTIPLLDIIKPNLLFDATSVEQDQPGSQPRLITRRLGGDVETRFVWKPPLIDKDNGILTLQLERADLLLDAKTTRSTSGEGRSVVIGQLRNAGLDFKNAINVAFGELQFRAEEGRKMEVSAKDVVLTFMGDLEFVNSLRSILPESGFEDPPFLTVDGQGVVAGYTLGLPSVGIGIFSLQNIALIAALSVPFVGKPAGVRFAISERHKPFLVTVSLFGGGGFFALAVSANGLEQIEAAIEFGGNIALNLLIASGGVYVMAGIYFGLTANSVQLTGYLRCGGYLEVLGLISVSVEFYLAFTYRKKSPVGNEVWGQASLSVCVKIALFSKSVTLSVERRFAGSDGDPSFRETMAPIQWAEYLQAFA